MSTDSLSAKSVIPHQPGWFLFLGIAYILGGMLAIALPLVVTLATVFVFGVMMMIAGGVALIHSFWTHRWDGFAIQLLAGILAAVMGFLLIMDAEMGAVVITLILGSYFLVSGGFRLVFALTHTRLHHRGALIFSGAITLLLGILIMIHWPSSAMWVIGTFIGIDLLFYGFSLISLASAIKKQPPAA
jgi:uncharacterized membrane protein HdeD (DUF308 family)